MASTQPAVGVSLADRERLSLAVHARRLPRQAWAALAESHALVTQANALWQGVDAELRALREQARAEGLAQGRAEAVAEMAARLAQAQRRAQELLDAQETRVLTLAVAIVRRIAPRLDAGELVVQLAGEALQSLRSERGARLRVHPAQAAAVRARLAQENGLRVIEDPQLDTLGVVLESDEGTVVAGFADQLAQIEAALHRSLQELPP